MADEYFQNVTSFICGGQFAAIVTNWKVDDAGLSGNPYVDAENLNSALELDTLGPGDGWCANLALLLGDDCFVSALRSRRMSSGGGPTAVRVFTPSEFPGAFGGEMEAFQTAAVINWAPAESGGITGRNRIPGVSSDALVNNRFTDAYQGVVLGLIAESIAGFQHTTPVWQIVVLSDWPATPVWLDVVGGYLSPTPGHIKARRLPV